MAAQQRRKLIYETVLEHIKSEILQDRLKPGTRLPTVAVLAEQLEVNPASVREAYRVLESMGILEVTQGRGTFVASAAVGDDGNLLRHFQLAGRESLTHLLEARKLLEPGVAALAAQRATESEANAILHATLEAEALNPNPYEWIELNIRFHDLIVSAAHNPVAAQMLAALYDTMRDVQPLAAQIPDTVAKALYFHKLIAQAIKAENPDAARAFMCQHIESFEEELNNFLQASDFSEAEKM